MERSAQVEQGIVILGTAIPSREQLLDTRDLFARLFQIQRQQVGIDRQQRRQSHARLRHCRHQGLELHDGALRVGQRLEHGARGEHLGGLVPRGGDGGRPCSLRLGIDGRQSQVGVVEHVPRVAATGMQGLDVVLKADDGIGQALERSRRKAHGGLHQHGQLCADAVQYIPGPRFIEHGQAGIDAAHQFGPVVET